MKILKLALIIAVAVIGCGRQDTQIVFAPKAFFDGSRLPGADYVYVAGTLTGSGVAYKNNTVAITCYQDRMTCLTYSVEQIGPNQIGRLDAPTSYPITKWTPEELVATGDSDAVSCREATISIVRRSESVVWVEEPINQSSAKCKDADTRLLKWTIEDSPGWRSLHDAAQQRDEADKARAR